MLGHADRARARAAAAVRGGERLVQVQVQDVDPDAAHVDLAQDGVHVGAVAVDETALGVHDLRDRLDVLLEEAERVGVGHHDAGGVLVHDRGHHLGGEDAARARPDRDRRVAAECRARRIGAVGRVRDDDLGARPAQVLVVGVEDEHAGQLPVRARPGLERDGVQARDLRQDALQRRIELQRPLAELVRQQRVRAREAGVRGLALVGLGVVLHRAGAERVHARVDREVPGRQADVVAHDVDLAQVRDVRVLPDQSRRRLPALDVRPRQREAAAAFAAAFPQQGFVQDETGGAQEFGHDCTSRTRRSISARGMVSVTQSR